MSETRKGLLENEIKIKDEPPDIDPYPGNLYPIYFIIKFKICRLYRESHIILDYLQAFTPKYAHNNLKS